MGRGARSLCCIVAVISVTLMLVAPLPATGQPPDTTDPLSDLLQWAIAAMDQSYQSWDTQPNQVVDSTTFTINYLASITPDARRRLDRRLITHADPDRDRRVTRDEAKRFLEIQLGIRSADGTRLRHEDGRLVDFATFLELDRTADEVLSLHEFSQSVPKQDDAAAAFAALDLDGDQQVSIAEFADQNSPFLLDPIADFHAADANSDGDLDIDELHRLTAPSRRHLIAANLSAFDSNKDNRLSLREYRLSMLANHSYPWNTPLVDQDRDRQLSFQEFVFDSRDHVTLLRRYYFHRLDHNGDGRLSTAEFPFRVTSSDALYRISIDGEEVREIYRDDGYPKLSHPAIAPTGDWIVCQATTDDDQTLIVLMDADGNDARVLCQGAMASWSADGQQLVVLRDDGGQSPSAWIIDRYGTPQQRIDAAQAVQWSPSGQQIALIKHDEVWIHDVATANARRIFRAADHQWQSLVPGLGWSPDGKRIAVQGRRDQQHQISVLSALAETQPPPVFTASRAIGDDLAWLADGNSLLLSIREQDSQLDRMHRLALTPTVALTPIAEVPATHSWRGGDVSPDGKWMALVAGENQTWLSPDRHQEQAARP